MATVVMEGLSKTYRGGVDAVSGVDLEIRDGELIVIVGPSGCGKSTLLRMVAGLESITAGSLLIDGQKVNRLEPAERDIAMVFQNYALYPHMTVFDNLAYGLKNRGESRSEIRRKVRAAAESLELSELLKRKPSELSGGQRQRVAMGRAIVRQPKLFLFDEPLSNLDAKLRVSMRLEIKRLQRELGTTSLYVTHDQVEAMTLADRLVAMNGGRVEQVGTPMELYREPATLFVAGFIGSPAMNILPGTVRDRAVWFGDVGFSQLDRPDGETVSIGIRPEHFILRPIGASPLGGTVELVEHLGSDVFVHVDVLREREMHRLVVRLRDGNIPEEGTGIGVDLEPGKLRLFDADGAAIAPPGRR
ncbi:sn-glycerol-3-phosphate import ATP-binding protein UgpC [Paralimibaculum aggregatum]|uniref:Sn-glycerol-3-phosphate import ATP-binding protein UgpC n=1 Tax=Paralimibaculum aggregatum TaxID=3036245 RepID=A0ABQ6LCN9_9RHOB|nr:sn-glycerol-3-phosphate ABC transporter ATP-binding protein UgpC [Limibaculum sp. NKW23]GMG81139.1 sn-glycerol-3-phosphate import ATP-binding protein UgpC [Limibaculum sp. NKW23]